MARTSTESTFTEQALINAMYDDLGEESEMIDREIRAAMAEDEPQAILTVKITVKGLRWKLAAMDDGSFLVTKPTGHTYLMFDSELDSAAALKKALRREIREDGC